jgi:hypothetical protein
MRIYVSAFTHLRRVRAIQKSNSGFVLLKYRSGYHLANDFFDTRHKICIYAYLV